MASPGRHILIADDNAETSEALRDLLAIAGHRCTIARGGASAYRSFINDPPDLVVTDLNMAGGDGYVLMHRIRQHGKTPILVITGCNTAYARERIDRDFHGVVVLTKPFARPRFLDAVERLLDGGGAPDDPLSKQLVG